MKVDLTSLDGCERTKGYGIVKIFKRRKLIEWPLFANITCLKTLISDQLV